MRTFKSYLLTVATAIIVLCSHTAFSQDRRAVAEAAAAAGEALQNQRTKEGLTGSIVKYQEALAIWRELDDKDKQAHALLNIASSYKRLGDATRSLVFFEEALALAQTLGDKYLEADILLTMSPSLDLLGEVRRSIDASKRALGLAREIGDQQLQAIALTGLGSSYDTQGDKQTAIDYYGQALPLVRAINDKKGEISVLQNLAAVYYSLGEIERALPLFEETLALAEQAGDKARISIILNNLGAANYALKNYQRSIDYYNRSLAIKHEIVDRVGESIALNNLGRSYDDLGQKQKAMEVLQQALTMQRELKLRSREATTLSNIGKLYYGLQDYEKAFEYNSLSLPIRREVGDVFGEARTLSDLAAVERMRGKPDEALGLIRNAVQIVESVRASLASPDLRATYFAGIQEYYQFEIDLLMGMHEKEPGKGYDALAFQTSESSRARVLLDILSDAKADIKKDVDPALLDQARALLKDLNAKDKERRAATSGTNTKVLDKQLDDISIAYNDLQQKIKASSPRYASLTQPRPLGASDVQKMLDADTLLLEYSLGKDNSYLWVVSTSAIKTYRLPKRVDIETLARRVHDLVKTADGAGEAQKALADLGKVIIAPANADLGNKRLVIVPDGVLGYTPFAALTGNAGTDPLVVGHEITYLPSASTLAALRDDDPLRKPQPEVVAVIADPVFDASDTRVAAGSIPKDTAISDLATRKATRDAGFGTTLPRLPGTRREATTILSLVPETERMRAVDFDASLSTVTSPDLGRYRIVHFATHGLLDSQHPELSGIVLSLVDRKGNAQDGFLRLNDIFNLKLPVDLVVLSACQTALGKEIRGEGMVGLTRGFMYAGARRVAASQWAVDDQATSEMMLQFYKGMLGSKKLKPAAALREAQISMIKSRRFNTPYYWSAFVLQGEWK